jgi:hypothetical protein
LEGYATKAEEVGIKLALILSTPTLDITELRNSLRLLGTLFSFYTFIDVHQGSLSRGAFGMIGSSLSPTDVTQITENTQIMLRIGNN